MSDKENKRNDQNLEDYIELLKWESEYGISGRKDADAEKDREFLEAAQNGELEEEFEENFSDESEITEEQEDFADEEAEYEDDEEPEDEKPAEAKKKKSLAQKFKALSKKKKAAVIIVAVILALIIIGGIAGGIIVTSKFGKMGDKIDFSEDIDTPDVIPEDIIIDIGSADFQNALKSWATTGNDSKIKSKNVVNVLLIGADAAGSNTDSMILVSVNKEKKTLKLVSFLRDSYLYIDSGNFSRCTKLNAAYSMGGVKCLMETIENNYKITIDGYVMVNFDSFKELINAMGGVTVDVQEYEANYISSTYYPGMPWGEDVTLDGEQALVFSRVRDCDADGDVSRTRRQRQVIESILNRVKNSSVSELNKYVDVLLPYVDTGYSYTEVISLGIKALTGGWAGFERSQIQMPPEDCRMPGSANMWIWVVDYQLAAYALQTELYGYSNIVLEDGRTSFIDLYNGTSGTGGTSYTPEQTSEVGEDVTEAAGDDTPEYVPEETEEYVPEEEPAQEADVTEAPAEEPAEETQAEETPAGDEGGEEEPQEEPVEEPADEEPQEEPEAEEAPAEE